MQLAALVVWWRSTKTKEAVAHSCRATVPYLDCVGAGAPLHMQEHRLNGSDGAQISEVADQGDKMQTAAGLEFPMSQDDTCHTGIMFASGCLLMRRVFWREQKVRRRTFGPLGHIMQGNSKIPFPDIPEETDSTAFGKGGRERILLQLNFALQELGSSKTCPDMYSEYSKLCFRM